jgi:iodotyrosine deiodinase
MPDAPFVPLRFTPRPPDEMAARAAEFYAEMNRRRTVRHFSDKPVPASVVDDALQTAGTAPSGAHLQPWRFVVVRDPDLRRQLRAAAEEEERAFYGGRAPQEWRDALAPLGTDADKPFLETAPVLIAVFVQTYGLLPDGRRVKHYYASESVGIATGLLLAALHHAGLVSLTHTPSPMGFLNRLLDRPAHERPFLLVVAGLPAPDARVPDLSRKPLAEIASFL